MSKPAHFKIDPKLAALLGEGYRSTEDALKELVDNAWDADAEHVEILLPAELTTEPIVISDDGSGMTERDVREEYLHVANDRRSRKGALSIEKKRAVKGRKGIGKFAGLMAADTMVMETRARGTLTRLRITKADLLAAGKRDLDRIALPIETEDCDPADKGTRITLSGLARNLSHPSPEMFRRILVMEYDRKESFAITVNGEKVAIGDIPGETVAESTTLPGVGGVSMSFTISDKPLKHAGIAIRIGGKIVGRPSMLGLDEDETIPPKLLRRIYGEIEADGLEGEVTADWGAIFENSLGLAEAKKWATEKIGEKVKATFKKDVNLQKARLQKDLNQRLANLPENRRKTAEQAIHRILEKLYADSDERVGVVVSLMLDAFEKDEYWIVLKSIDDATRSNVVRLAEVLEQFGLVDLAIMAQQATGRLGFLDEFDRLIGSDDTLEKQVHAAIERNLWMLGADYRLLTSNESLGTLIERWAGGKYEGERASKRPDLFLARLGPAGYLLIEFKRPSHTITRFDEAQAATYRDEIASYVAGGAIDALVVGGRRDGAAATVYDSPRLRVMTYVDVVAQARDELMWLVSELSA